LITGLLSSDEITFPLIRLEICASETDVISINKQKDRRIFIEIS